MANRLTDATSPYLRQHATNPVDWWPWCDEAFAHARRRDVPILLSVGYAACHWCHVMAHESFEVERTAALVNERFVAIKVDREERPDVDAVYMAATQALTGSGGWPMTVFLDHDGHAFFAGTYFPPRPRPGVPGFTQVLTALDAAWRTDRGRVAQAAAGLHEALSGQTLASGEDRPATVGDVVAAVAALATTFDARRGGFGGAPKFPPTPALEFLLRAHALGRQHESKALAMAATTMTQMVRGGIYDQLVGGFARYSVDSEWVVPHFEKMLYDNAQLLRCYLHWWRATGDPLARRVAEETADFLLAELRTPEGGFASSLDADSDGREGAFYVWTPAELVRALGADDAEWVARLCGVTAAGTFEAGASVLQLPADPDDPARWRRCRARLVAARQARVRPARDDKVVAAWNGLAIAALAEAGALLERPELVAAAEACAEHLQAVHWLPAAGRLSPAGRVSPAHRLLRVSLCGTVNPHAPAVLEDYADLAEGLLALYQVTGDERWYRWADELLALVLDLFGDGRGGFFDTAADAPALVRRPQDPTDGVAPSGWSAAVQALITLGALGGGSEHRQAAERANAALLPLARRSPRFTGWSWAAACALLAGPVQVAVVMPAGPRASGPPGPSAAGPPVPGAVVTPAGPRASVTPVPGAAGPPVPDAVVTPAGPRASVTPVPGAAGLPVPDAAVPPAGPSEIDTSAERLGLHRAALASTSPGLVVAVATEGLGGVPLLRDRTCPDGRPTAYPCRGFVCQLPVTSVAALREVIERT